MSLHLAFSELLQGTCLVLLGVLAGLLIFLFRILRLDMAALRQDIKGTNARIDSLRQEMRTDIAALHSRIDILYQSLFNHKGPAA